MPLFDILVDKGILEPQQPTEEVKIDDEFVITKFKEDSPSAELVEEEKKVE